MITSNGKCMECCRIVSMKVYYADLEANREKQRSKKHIKRESMRRRRRADPEKYRERWRAWRDRNPDKVAVNSRNRRARKNAAIGSHSSADIAAIFKSQRGKCAYCRKSLGAKFDVDHIIPLSRGGTNFPKNLQITCQFCNTSKHSRDPVEFARSTGRLL